MSSVRHIKKLMSLREGLHVMMQCYKESITYFVKKGFVCRWNVHKMRSESSEYVRIATGFFTTVGEFKKTLEGYF